MSDRRRATRFALVKPVAAHLRVLQDVVVERVHGKRLVVLASAPATTDEELALELAAPDGVLTLMVRIVDSSRVAADGPVRYRLDMRVLSRTWICAPEARQA
jgi:hypothetical protein